MATPVAPLEKHVENSEQQVFSLSLRPLLVCTPIRIAPYSAQQVSTTTWWAQSIFTSCRDNQSNPNMISYLDVSRISNTGCIWWCPILKTHSLATAFEYKLNLLVVQTITIFAIYATGKTRDVAHLLEIADMEAPVSNKAWTGTLFKRMIPANAPCWHVSVCAIWNIRGVGTIRWASAVAAICQDFCWNLGPPCLASHPVIARWVAPSAMVYPELYCPSCPALGNPSPNDPLIHSCSNVLIGSSTPEGGSSCKTDKEGKS